jgi:acetyl-CoA carboxylase biotin carboxyl carrier protein
LNFKEILELIDKVADRGIGGVEIEQAGTKLRIEGTPSHPPAATYVTERQETPASPSPAPMSVAAAAHAAETARAEAKAAEDEAGLHIITSPIVGTFYRMPNPESQPFVSVGDRVSQGKVLCIVEAMKLMNEIESDVDGVITAIYPQNGQPVEYGEKLFAVKG